MRAFWRAFTDFVGFVVGPFFVAYYLLDFGHGPAGPGPYYYFFRHNSQLGVALGIALIGLGLVMRSWRKDASPQSPPRRRQEPKKRYYANSRRSKKSKQDQKSSRPKQNQKPRRPEQNQKPQRPEKDQKPQSPDRNQEKKTQNKPASKES